MLVDSRSGLLRAVAVQPDGGSSPSAAEMAAGGALTPAIYRYTSDGAPDPTFSGDGKVALPLATRAARPLDVILAPDGSIAVAGSCVRATSPYAVDAFLRG